MKRVLVLGTLIAALFLLPSAAQAHPGTWYWTPARASGALLEDGIQWQNGYHTVNYARCGGYGLYFRRGGSVFYKHQICYVDTDEDYPYYVRLHVISRFSWVVDFLRYA